MPPRKRKRSRKSPKRRASSPRRTRAPRGKSSPRAARRRRRASSSPRRKKSPRRARGGGAAARRKVVVHVPEEQGYVHGARGHLIAAKLGGRIHLAHVRRARGKAAYAADIDDKTYYFNIDESPGFAHLHAEPEATS